MMSNEEVRGRAVWRRAIVPIAATAATVIGGMVIATPANAATPPPQATFTVNGGSSVSITNDQAVPVPSTITIDNTVTNNVNQGNITAVLDFTVPTNLPCTAITLTNSAAPDPQFGNMAGSPAAFTAGVVDDVSPTGNPQTSSGTCRAYADTTLAAAATLHGPTQININGTVAASGFNPGYRVTGAVTGKLSVYNGTFASPTLPALATSGTVTANLVNPIYPTVSLTQASTQTGVSNNGGTATYGVVYGTVPALMAGGANDATATVRYTVTVPTTVKTGVLINGSAADCTTTAGVCVRTVATPAGAAVAGSLGTTGTVTVTVTNTAATGNMTVKAELLSSTIAGTPVEATSNTVTTPFVGQSAPAWAAAPPAATIYQSYSYQFMTNVGSPAPTFTAYGWHKNADGSYAQGSRTAASTSAKNVVLVGPAPGVPTPTGCGTVAAPTTTVIDLSRNEGDCVITFDTATGKITAKAAALNTTQGFPYWTWTINAHSSQNTAVPASPFPADLIPQPASPVAGDLFSPVFTLPVLFKDTAANSTFGPEIYQLADAGAIGGYADGTFRGSNAVTRQAVAHFVVQTLGLFAPACTSASGANPSLFNDVSYGDQFCADINAMSKAGIANGYKDGGFHPGALITRQAISAFLYRTDAVHRGVPGTSVSDAACATPIPFNDVDAGNPFCGDIEWMASNKITTGYPDGGFHPTGNTSREAMAAFLARLETMWGV